MSPILLLAALAFASPGRKVVVCDDVRDPLTLDPQREFSEKNHTILQQIYEPLVRFDSDGRIEPALAVTWERKDPLRMRFHLREGVRFHNGEPFDAEAVRFSLSRYLDPKTGFPGGGFLTSIDKAEVIDAGTVDIVTKFPDGLLLNRLAALVLIFPPGYVKEKGETALASEPVGTGPFRFVRWIKGDRIMLEANPDYWRKGFPRISALEFKFAPLRDQVDLLLSGQVDLVTDVPGTQTLRLSRSGQVQIEKRPTFATVAATVNTSTGPLADVRVRRALNLATDKGELIRYDLLGNGEPLAGVTFPAEFGHNDSLKPYPFDPERARRELEQSGWPHGFHLKTFLKSNAERTGRIIAAQLKRVGVTLDVTMVPDALLVETMRREPWDLAIADVPDPMQHSYFIQAILFYSKSPFSLTRDPEYDSRLERMIGTLDEKRQREACEGLDAYIFDNALGLFTYQKIRTYGMTKGLTFTPYRSGMPYFFDLAFKDSDPHGDTAKEAKAVH
jgi:peptide/nickel transport system substrate-binding protein